MKRKFTQSEKETCWSLWKEGLGFSDIGHVLDAKPGSVFTLLRENGGVTLPTPKRSQRHLNLDERGEITISLAANISIRQIACSLHRSPSTISREINKNGGIGKHQLKWSQEQISGWLKIEFPFHRDMQISSETIYKSLYIRSRKLLDIALMNNLPRANKIRQNKRHSRRGNRGTISIVNGISINKRPSEIDERSISGHWEGDLISGSGNMHIVTLVDRKTPSTMEGADENLDYQ